MGTFELVNEGSGILPVLVDGSEGVYKFFASSDIIVPSLFRELFLEVKQLGINDVPKRLVRGYDYEDDDNPLVVFDSREVNTGVVVNNERMEVFRLFVRSDLPAIKYLTFDSKDSVICGTGFVNFRFLNMQPYDMRICKGECIGYGTFERIVIKDEITTLNTMKRDSKVI